MRKCQATTRIQCFSTSILSFRSFSLYFKFNRVETQEQNAIIFNKSFMIHGYFYLGPFFRSLYSARSFVRLLCFLKITGRLDFKYIPKIKTTKISFSHWHHHFIYLFACSYSPNYLFYGTEECSNKNIWRKNKEHIHAYARACVCKCV